MSGQSAKRLLASLSLAILFAGMAMAQSDQGTAKSNQAEDTKPKSLYVPQPQYTNSARQDRIQGTVTLKTTIDADGRPSGTKIVKSLRSDLDWRAIETVNTWKFRPAMKDGKPVPFTMSIDVDFRLTQN
jgi:TonB family protein